MKALKIEQYMNDKTELIEAIDNYTVFTLAQRTLLKTLVRINLNNIVTASVAELCKLTGISKPVVYKSLELFIHQNLIEKMQGPNKGIGILKLNPTQLLEIQQIYNKKYH